MVEILDNSIGHCEEIPSFEVESRINSFYPFLYNQIFFNLALRLKHIICSKKKKHFFSYLFSFLHILHGENLKFGPIFNVSLFYHWSHKM